MNLILYHCFGNTDLNHQQNNRPINEFFPKDSKQVTPSFRSDQIQVLFEQYYISLVAFSWRIVKCDEAARDIVQDTFVKLLEKNYLFQDNENAQKSYLYATVKNASLNYLRREGVAGKYLEVNDFKEQDEKLLLDALIYAELVGHLHKAVDSLPEVCQRVFKLSYIEEKSNQEIAEEVNLSINTVKTHKQRALKLLRQRLIPIYKTVKTIFPFFF
ncbi:RNA polymerase sigma-70 factor [Pedobacter sp. FW305-3-2-15-E-R2A2]|uniref:RNA polymerase sigma-70 factor n=1 Tax=Pedobacter sp. FW305-3-2-15-E-R2A2 TaxID=3140251 RepID=UPI003140C175